MLKKDFHVERFRGIPGSAGRDAYTVCRPTPPPERPGEWKEVCSEVLISMDTNSGVSIPPNARMRLDEEGKPVVYQRGNTLYFAYLVCRTERVDI